MRGGGPRGGSNAVWNFTENSSVLVSPSVPYWRIRNQDVCATSDRHNPSPLFSPKEVLGGYREGWPFQKLSKSFWGLLSL